MKIKIGDFEFTEVWDGVLYKKLSHYPDITGWELKNIIDFIDYESSYNRSCEIECDDKALISVIDNAIADKSYYKYILPPKLITECTACPVRKGCVTQFVCHTSSIENAIKIFKSGSLLSAVKARKQTSAYLKSESRNAANDPEDYFDYIMFSRGNCQAGDRLVMERKLKRFPNEYDLSVDFTPGVRFYFKYDEIIKHPLAISDGVLPVKIKDEVKLCQWVYAIIIPEEQKSYFENIISNELRSKIHYIKNDCKDIWEWSEKVYCYIENLN